MEIEWSGYYGDGVNLGNEYIKITGETTANLTMKAYGYWSWICQGSLLSGVVSIGYRLVGFNYELVMVDYT